MLIAQYVYEDIRGINVEKESYDPPEKFLDNVGAIIPKTLRIFLEHLISKHKKGKISPWDRKITSIAHMIMMATRPRDFMSNLLLTLAAVVDKKYGSSDLIKLLASLGMCSSYDETQLFMASIILNDKQAEIIDGYAQLIADNADWNTQTSTGYGSFHTMGVAMSVTPQTAVNIDFRIDRLKSVPAASVLGKKGYLPILEHKPEKIIPLSNIEYLNLLNINKINMDVTIRKAELLWLFGKYSKNFHYIGWNNFQEEIHLGEKYILSRMVPLPFVMAKATDDNTIFTVLNDAHLRCIKLKQSHIFLTFDLQLYIKAMEIKACYPKFDNVILRIGGFHWLMSYMGSIGAIMEGSGIQEVMNTVFALGSIEKILNGHAYSRAVRGFSLINTVLASIILDDMEKLNIITNEDKNFLSVLLDDITRLNNNKKLEDKKFNSIYEKFIKHTKDIAQRGPTAKLWIQLFHMTSLVKQFIEAERSGDWKLHLDTCQRMIPIFCASFHYKYAEYGYLYLQQMLNLKNIMNPEEYKKFTEQGYFTIRRTDKFFSGIFTDQTIEQFVMAQIKMKGGIIQRYLKEGSIAAWIVCLIALIQLTASLSNFSGINFHSTEQHKDSRVSKVEEDVDALNKIAEFFHQNDPFPAVPYIMSIASGLKGNSKINCFNAFENSLTIMESMVSKRCTLVKFKKINRVVPLLAMESNVFVNGKLQNINLEAIFVRILLE